MSSDQRKNILVFNPGSNSLKIQIVVTDAPVGDFVRGTKAFSGVVEPIGPEASFTVLKGREKITAEKFAVRDHGDAAAKFLARIDAGLASQHGIKDKGDIHVVGHRVVHGGDRYTDPVPIDDAVIREVEKLEDLAPLHNASALSVIRASRAVLEKEVPQVAVFDTAFHRTIPNRARLYGIPWELTQRYGIQRFGFHGISHKYMMMRYAEVTATLVDQTSIITLHLEGGSSATAIVGGKSIDTSMGFTPLEGLMMGTRSGDIDPALVSFLSRKEDIDIAAVEELLNRKSGLLGVSGYSEDTRELVARQSEERIGLALDMFAYRVRKYIGAYLAAAGNTSAIVFGGGIGENTPEVRRRICEGLESLGLQFDTDRNQETIDCEGRISRDGSRLHVFVIPTEEGLMIAHEALLCCTGPSKVGARPA